MPTDTTTEAGKRAKADQEKRQKEQDDKAKKVRAENNKKLGFEPEATHDRHGSPLSATVVEPVNADELNELQAEAQATEEEETRKRVTAQAGDMHREDDETDEGSDKAAHSETHSGSRTGDGDPDGPKAGEGSKAEDKTVEVTGPEVQSGQQSSKSAGTAKK